MNNKSLANLKPWPKGISGNPAGRRVGSRNISTIVQEILEQDIDDDFPINERLTKLLNGKNKSYVEAVAIAMTKKAIDGDVRVATWLVEQQQKGEAKLAADRCSCTTTFHSRIACKTIPPVV